jgi:hypothetical protein
MPAHPAALLRRPGTLNSKRGTPVSCEVIWRGGGAVDITEIEDMLDQLNDAPLFTCREPVTHGNGHDRHSPLEASTPKPPVDVAERLGAMRYKGPGDSSIHLTQLHCMASLLRSGCTLDYAVDEILEATRAAVANNARAAKWDWQQEAIDIRRMGTDFVCKNPELAGALPNDLLRRWEEAVAKGKRPKIVYAKHIGWHVRGFGDNEKSREAPTNAPPKEQSAWHYYDTTKPTPPRWLVKGILPEVGVGILSGQWGSYKTTVALDLSVSAMTGLPFAGQYRVKRKGAVLYFAVEGSGTLQTRLTAIARSRGAPSQLPFAWRSDCPMLTDKRAADIMIGYVTEAAAHFQQTYKVPVTLLWVDTMITAAGFAPGEENDAAATQKALTTLQKVASRTGTLVMAVDHIGKTLEAGTRGSSNKEASVDTVLATLADRETSGDVANSRLATRKQRDGISGFETPFAPETVELGADEDGDPVSAIVLSWGERKRAQPTTPLPVNAQLLLRVLKGVASAQGVPLVPTPGAGVVQAVRVTALRDEFYSQYPADDGKRGRGSKRRMAFKRAMEALQARPLIAVRIIDGHQMVWKIGNE